MKKAIRAALDDRGYDTLTPVQTSVLEPELQGRDLLVSAQTGSGKTLGFGLAIAPTLLQDQENFSQASIPLALVIAPTRELAMQVKRELAWLYAKAGAVLASCVGGMDMRDERRALARGAHVVVATPGRLRDHIMRGSIDLKDLRAVVLDEADEMLDLGFREDLEFILGEAPTDRQTLLFSATVPKAIAALAKSYQTEAIRVAPKSESKQHADIEYKAYNVADRDAENAVINTLLYHRAPNAIVFGNTRAMVNRLTTRLSNRGFKAVALSGELSQAERTNALQAMRDGRADVCIATDVAARGIDLPNLDLVVHAELPSNHETLLHRSGRTGRAGRKGVSALIVMRKFRKKADRILSAAKVSAEWQPAPSADAVNAREEERMLADPNWHQAAETSQTETVSKLVDTYSPEQLATAVLRLYRAAGSTPEELSDPGAMPAKRQEFGPSTWFTLAYGRADGAAPGRLLPKVCSSSDLTRDDIGAIRIQDGESFVQIKDSAVANFVSSLGPDMMLEGDTKVKQLSSPPSFDKGHRSGGKPHRKSGSKSDWKPKSTPPIDWNDEPARRPKKPKPADRAKADGKPGKSGKPYRAKPADGSFKPKKPRTAEGGGKPARSTSADVTGKFQKPRTTDGTDRPRRAKPADGTGKPTRKPKTGPKGPPPPVGKKNSKKNKARAAAAKAKKSGKASKE